MGVIRYDLITVSIIGAFAIVIHLAVESFRDLVQPILIILVVLSVGFLGFYIYFRITDKKSNRNKKRVGITILVVLGVICAIVVGFLVWYLPQLKEQIDDLLDEIIFWSLIISLLSFVGIVISALIQNGKK